VELAIVLIDLLFQQNDDCIRLGIKKEKRKKKKEKRKNKILEKKSIKNKI